jgi:enterochelin esterase-like enzyme
VRIDLRAPPWATHLLSDLTDWHRAPAAVADLEPLLLADDARLEYAWRDGDGRLRADPSNDRSAENPWWPEARLITGPAWRPHPLAQVPDALPAGRTLRFRLDSRYAGPRRRVILYTPAGLEDAWLPVIYVQDGTGFFHHGRPHQVLEALVTAGRITPAHLALVEPRERDREYTFHEPFLRFYLEELLPFVEEQVRTVPERHLLGASLGGLVSATLAWRAPDLFDTVLALSGAWTVHPDDDPPDAYGGREWITERVLADPPRDIRWYLGCGTLEWLRDPNRRLRDALAARGATIRHEERTQGHTWGAWRSLLPEALLFALGRP